MLLSLEYISTPTGIDNNDIKKFTKNLKNFFETNKPSINTLIPVDINMKPVLDNVVDYVSIPTVIMDNITNNEIKKNLIKLKSFLTAH